MAEPKAGKSIAFQLVGDDLFLFETVRDMYEGEREDDEAKVASALDGLDPEVRALVQSRMVTQSRKELSQREVFMRAMREAMAAREAAEDAALAEVGA